MIKKVHFTNKKGMKLAGWLHTPKGKGPFPALIRTHGWKSSKEGSGSTALVDKFKDMIYLRFDMHGHGESEGSIEQLDVELCVDDMKSAVDFVSTLKNVDKNKIAVTGSSLGGLTAILTAAWSEKVALAIPVCPVSDFHPFRIKDIKYENLLKLLKVENVYKEVERMNTPMFIIHGDADPVVPISQSIELIKHLKNGVLHVIPGADHVFSKEEHFKHMIREIDEFVHEKFANGKK
jgi:uncharacterized protein